MDRPTEDPQVQQIVLPPEDGSIKRFLPGLKRKYSFKDTFAALRHPNYRLWFWGQMISLFGSWMQATALAYFIFELTKSTVFLGYIGFASGIPAWLLTFYAGAVADKFHREKILVYTQTGMMVLSLALAALTFLDIITPWQLIIFSMLLGTMNAFDAPSRHAFVNELVSKDDLVNAIALNSTMFHTATSIGPAIGGIIYALFGPALCFSINAVSYLAVIFSLKKMDIRHSESSKNNNRLTSEIKDGFRYLITEKDILTLVLITTTTSLFATGLITLIPSWAVDVLGGDSTTNGFLQSARGIGAVIFALIIATINKYFLRGKLLFYSIFGLPVVLIIFSMNSSLVISLALLILVGGFMISIYNLSNGLIQTIVDEKYRGRIMGIYSFTFLAFMPIGSLIIGLMADVLSTPDAVLFSSVLLLMIFILLRIRFPKISGIR
ncbi:MAG: MFS transporter [Melioribacteraceae bacterium]|nr:MFS transporter [Melioribacteraceae bacterium]